ncbi:ABC transporter permease [Paraconexibacter sp.]|uniref:ABC transporter permease n=1 Tax=Paraconexibacter sp. TaxID=2949640 RepID=UPI003568513C
MILPLLLVLLLLGVWQAYTELASVEPLILPSPVEIGRSLWEDRTLLLDNLGVTATEVGLGVLCALATGVGAAIVLHRVQVLRRATYPLLIGTQAVPVVTLAPLLVFWLGFGLAPKLAIITLVCFFPVAVTTLDALDRTDPDQLKLMRTLGATRRQAFWWAQMPAALPAALSGARISVAIAVIGAVLAEDSGSNAGLGHLLRQSTGQLETARGYAAVVVLAAFAITLFYTLVLVERRLLPWTQRPGGPS